MYEVVLVAMPFGGLMMASLSLTQLKSVVQEAYPGRVRVRIAYATHDFAAYLGADLYQEIALGFQHHTSGLGDWLFRSVAFPELADNADQFFARFYPRRDAATKRFKELVMKKRSGIVKLFSRLVDKYALDRADLVGFSSQVFQNTASFGLARMLRERNPDVTVVLGGGNCEYPMGRVIAEHVPAIDYVFSGPSLVSFPEFVGYRMAGDTEACVRIDGVFCRENVTSTGADEGALTTESDLAGKPVVDQLGRERCINTPSRLDYDDFLDSFAESFPRADSAVRTSLPFETSRGCWWGEKSHCTFCGLNDRTLKYRFMEPEFALTQMRSLFEYSSRCSHLQCVDNIIPKSYLREVVPHLDTPENMGIFYEAKSDLGEEDVRVLAKARITVQLGIEALSTRALKALRKGCTPFQNVTVLKHCAVYDLPTFWNLLMGIPGIGPGVYQKYVQDCRLLSHVPPPASVYPIRFDRYSPYYNEAQAHGLDLRPCEFYSMVYPLPPSAIQDLAYYVTDYNLDAEYLATTADWFGKVRKAVDGWRSLWHGGDRALRARLEFQTEGEDIVILDSRSGTSVRYALPNSCLVLLQRLAIPSSLDRLAGEFAGRPEINVERDLELLRDRGLLFEDEGKFMNLILPADHLRREPREDVTLASPMSA
ncbi:RiPP maturation radical SAM C-methyltransferase [uncultured Paludibaculum sp.]|uniref:RiPP maturation radical SAM C-methyltransferase n=1 Tax=uncultured Paludibaculum sp. TaxID=1765020 RepID=UPI002AAC3066|nr:RiPP maturation radical SAM C-methyltransferase [uncultured Paludibaculum sp.]